MSAVLIVAEAHSFSPPHTRSGGAPDDDGAAFDNTGGGVIVR